DREDPFHCRRQSEPSRRNTWHQRQDPAKQARRIPSKHWNVGSHIPRQFFDQKKFIAGMARSCLVAIFWFSVLYQPGTTYGGRKISASNNPLMENGYWYEICSSMGQNRKGVCL